MQHVRRTMLPMYGDTLAIYGGALAIYGGALAMWRRCACHAWRCACHHDLQAVLRELKIEVKPKPEIEPVRRSLQIPASQIPPAQIPPAQIPPLRSQPLRSCPARRAHQLPHSRKAPATSANSLWSKAKNQLKMQAVMRAIMQRQVRLIE